MKSCRPRQSTIHVLFLVILLAWVVPGRADPPTFRIDRAALTDPNRVWIEGQALSKSGRSVYAIGYEMPRSAYNRGSLASHFPVPEVGAEAVRVVRGPGAPGHLSSFMPVRNGAATLLQSLAVGALLEAGRRKAHGRKVDPVEVVADQFKPSTLAASAGFAVAQAAAGAAMSAVLPGVGGHLGRILVNAAVRMSAGALGGRLAGDLVAGRKLDAVDIVGSSLFAGVGMALGQVFIPIPFAGAVVGSVTGDLLWKLVSRSLRPEPARNAACAPPVPAERSPETPRPGVGSTPPPSTTARLSVDESGDPWASLENVQR